MEPFYHAPVLNFPKNSLDGTITPRKPRPGPDTPPPLNRSAHSAGRQTPYI